MRLNVLIGIKKDGTAEIINPASVYDHEATRKMIHSFRLEGTDKFEQVLLYVDPYDKVRLAKREVVQAEKPKRKSKADKVAEFPESQEPVEVLEDFADAE